MMNKSIRQFSSTSPRIMTLITTCVAILGLTLLTAQPVAMADIVATVDIQCTYDPASGQPNPFGSRAFITVTERDGNTHFRFEQFPTLIPALDSGAIEAAQAITVESHRTVIFYDTDIESARELMRIHLEYYEALIGRADRAGFSSYDEAMSCH